MRPTERAKLQSEAELEVSQVAARDVDGFVKCEQCDELRTAMLLMDGGWYLCGPCWRSA